MQKINSEQIDYSSLKTYIPDYSRKETVNRWASSSSWTSDRQGFIYFWLYSYNTTGAQLPQIRINNQIVDRTVTEAAGGNGARVTGNAGILPIDINDTISFTNAGSVNARELYFIPGRWVSTG